MVGIMEKSEVKTAAPLSRELATAEGRTQWGWVRVWGSSHGAVRVEGPQPQRPGPVSQRRPAPTQGLVWAWLAVGQIAEYLAGERRVFALQLDWRGISDFGRRVLQACQQIPYGQTETYGGLAKIIGSPGAARAVGQALGHNRLPLVVPCHRVIAADGSLGGFGGGLSLKQRLLDLETGNRR